MLHLDGYSNGSFDLVVCFEAIEHVQEQRELIEGIARVMRPDGLVVLSTPDRDAYNAVIHDPNPFHLRELNRAELLDLLQPHFPHVALWGQTGISGSRLTLSTSLLATERCRRPSSCAGVMSGPNRRPPGQHIWSPSPRGWPFNTAAPGARISWTRAARPCVRATTFLRSRHAYRRAQSRESRALFGERAPSRQAVRRKVRRLARRIRAWVRSS